MTRVVKKNMKKETTKLTSTDSRREQILSIATGLFRDKGFSATSMSDIASAVGMSKPALYYHFVSKEDLFVAIVSEDQMDAGRQLAEIASHAHIPAPERLNALIHATYENMLNSIGGQMMPAIAETSSRFPEVAKDFRNGFIASQQNALHTIINDGIVSGDFDASKTDFIVELVFGPPIMMALTKSMFGKLEDEPEIDIQRVSSQHFEAVSSVLNKVLSG